MSAPGGDADVDALRTDRYLESLLIAGDRRASRVPSDAALDPALREAAVRLRHDLVRVHPSFRFEDRLAARLAEEAASMRLAPAVGGGRGVTTLRLRGDAAAAGAAARVNPPFDPLADAADEGIRPFIIGGALTSAALSIAGAAYVAWRRTRPGSAVESSPMRRAVRAAHAGRDRSPRLRAGAD